MMFYRVVRVNELGLLAIELEGLSNLRTLPCRSGLIGGSRGSLKGDQRFSKPHGCM
jgi:hypothetical protein